MPPGWKPCRRTYRTAPPPRRCRRSATSTSLNSRRSFRPAASAEIDQRDVRSAREPALSRTAPDRPTSPAPHRTALAPAAQPRPAPPGRALPSEQGVNFGRRSGVTFRRRLTDRARRSRRGCPKRGAKQMRQPSRHWGASPHEAIRILILIVAPQAEPSWRFWGLYVHVCKLETLREGYEAAKRNDGAPGIDGMTFEAIEAQGAEAFLEQIRGELFGRIYAPLPARRQEIPKDGGKVRVLSIPAIRDRVVQGALKLVLEPIFEADFQPGVVWIPSQADSA